MDRYLALLLEYLLARVGKEVLSWSMQQIIEYFAANPAEARNCAAVCTERYVSEMETDDDPYFWDKPLH